MPRRCGGKYRFLSRAARIPLIIREGEVHEGEEGDVVGRSLGFGVVPGKWEGAREQEVLLRGRRRALYSTLQSENGPEEDRHM